MNATDKEKMMEGVQKGRREQPVVLCVCPEDTAASIVEKIPHPCVEAGGQFREQRGIAC